MSFLAGLLRRELPATATPGSSAPAGGTAADAAVVPRLASRFEDPGAPQWPGNATMAALDEPAVEAGGTGGAPAGVAEPPAAAVPPAPREGTAAPSTAPRRAGDAGDIPARAMPGPPVRQPAAPGRPSSAGEQHPGPPPAEPGRLRTPGRPAVPALGIEPGPAASPAGARRGPDGENQALRRSGTVSRVADTVPAGRPGQRDRRATPGEPPGPGLVRPRLEPLLRSEPAQAPEQHIHVHIGRIEVKAVAAPPRRPAATERTGLMSLDEYLQGRP